MSYYEFIRNVQSYQQKVITIKQERHRIIDPNTFNISTYIGFFDKIYIRAGFRIDALYYGNSMGGKPYLCRLSDTQDFTEVYELISKKNESSKRMKGNLSSEANEKRYANTIDCNKKIRAFIKNTNIRQVIIPEDSNLGFLQYLFLIEMGTQFALFWHSRYEIKYIVYSIEPIEELVKQNNDPMYKTRDKDLQRLRQSSLIPKIKRESEYYQIIWYEYRQFEGIYKCTFRINRMKPFEIKLTHTEEVLQIRSSLCY